MPCSPVVCQSVFYRRVRACVKLYLKFILGSSAGFVVPMLMLLMEAADCDVIAHIDSIVMLDNLFTVTFIIS